MDFCFETQYSENLDVFDRSNLRDMLEALTGQVLPFKDETIARAGKMPEPAQYLTCAHLNSWLLRLGYDRVADDFFCFFFNAEKGASIDWAQFHVGLLNFRVTALLRWGNIKFGFKRWKGAERADIEKDLLSFEHVELKYYSNRGEELNPVEGIPFERRYLLGYLSGNTDHPNCEETRSAGRLNSARYLLYEHMDVYVATSMREADDFWHVAGVVRSLETSEPLTDLKLRVYDPTLSFEDGRATKGLQEALMLLRCRCCVYCLQQSDSFGKDSELASVLAQGKPVVIYAPDEQSLETEFAELPELCKKAGLDLRSILEDKLKRIGKDKNLLQDLSDAEVLEFVLKQELERYDNRVTSLREMHPLALQVNIQTGVANGVLIARSVEECARLTYQIMLREMRFRIAFVDSDEPAGTLGLYERTTDSLFRISTGDELLTNTFWNFHAEDLARGSARRPVPPASPGANGG